MEPVRGQRGRECQIVLEPMRKHDLICDAKKDYGDDQLANKEGSEISVP